MSQRIRRSLAVGLLAVFSLALPATSQAAGLWDPAAPTVWMARAWSWLEGLGLVPPSTTTPRRPATQWQKTGLAAPGDPSNITQPSPGPGGLGGPFQGSGIDPNGDD